MRDRLKEGAEWDGERAKSGEGRESHAWGTEKVECGTERGGEGRVWD